VVGFVDDGDGHLVESALTLLHQIFETSGARDDDVDTARERLHLRRSTHSTVDDHVAEPERAGQRIESLGHLGGEFTSGNEDQSARLTRRRTAAIGGQASDERQHEGEGLATSRATTSDDVEPGERVGKCLSLDGEGLGDSAASKDLDEIPGYTEGIERCRIGDGSRRRARRRTGGGHEVPLCRGTASARCLGRKPLTNLNVRHVARHS